MRGSRWALSWLAAAGLVCAAQHTDGGLADATAALNNGSLIVWAISSSAAPVPLRADLDIGYHEQTASTFGQAASNVGRSAGSTGTSAGSFGTSASNAGQTSSTYGQTAGSFGRASSNAGQTAGSYGKAPSDLGPGPGSRSQTAGSYGQPAGSFGNAPGTITPAPSQAVPVSMEGNPLYPNVEQAVHAVTTRFPGLNLTIIPIRPTDLRTQFAQATPDKLPDVLVGSPLPQEWTASGLGHDYGILTLGTTASYEPIGTEEIKRQPFLQASIMRQAHHPGTAAAFVVWLMDRGIDLTQTGQAHFANAAEPAAVALNAVRKILSGADHLTEADTDLAEFSLPDARRRALVPSSSGYESDEALSGLSLRINVVAALANDRLAVVALRVIPKSAVGFGVVHPFVVLRRNDANQWRVLQVSLNLAPEMLVQSLNEFARTTTPVTPDRVVHTLEVAQVAPSDGDAQLTTPELTWDNDQRAALFIVEWQRQSEDTWVDSHLFFVPNMEQRNQTRARARFGTRGNYRWRIWAVGLGGTLKLTSWRKLQIM